MGRGQIADFAQLTIVWIELDAGFGIVECALKLARIKLGLRTKLVCFDPRILRRRIALNSRGSLWVAKREYERARADFKEAIRVESDNSLVYHNFAYFLATAADEKYRDAQKAVEYAKKACELDRWKTSAYLFVLAVAYAEAGNFDAAKKSQQTAIELETDENKKAELLKGLEFYEQGKKLPLLST